MFLPLLLAAAGGVVKSEDANVDTNTSLIIVSNPEIKTPAPLSHNPVAKSILRRRYLILFSYSAGRLHLEVSPPFAGFVLHRWPTSSSPVRS